MLRFFEAHGTAYMVMEYERGDTLAQLVGELEQAYDEVSARSLLLPLLDGLATVHEAGFLHRDIKPANIVMRPGGAPVLIDFGAARQAVGSRSRSLTNIVTPRYAPLEQYGVDQGQGQWSDIYGLAAVMHLVLEDVEQQAVDAFLLDAGRAVDARDLLKFRVVEGQAEIYEALIDRDLGDLEIAAIGMGNLVLPGLRPERAAFQRVDIEPVDDQDVVERRLQRGKEADAGCREFLGGHVVQDNLHVRPRLQPVHQEINAAPE